MHGYSELLGESREDVCRGVRCELVSKVSFIRRSDEFLESIKKGIKHPEPVSEAKFSLLAGKIQGILLSRPPAAG
jgi:hypothetical protein